jgi:hypothetical protein
VEVEYGLFRQPKDLFSRHGKKAITMAKIILQLFCRNACMTSFSAAGNWGFGSGI